MPALIAIGLGHEREAVIVLPDFRERSLPEAHDAREVSRLLDHRVACDHKCCGNREIATIESLSGDGAQARSEGDKV